MDWVCLCPLWKSTTCSNDVASIYANLLEQQQQQRTKQNKKKSLRKELYRVVFLILTVQRLYQFLPMNVVFFFYHVLHTVNNTKKAGKEIKVVERRSCWWYTFLVSKDVASTGNNSAQVIFFSHSPRRRLTDFNIFVFSCLQLYSGWKRPLKRCLSAKIPQKTLQWYSKMHVSCINVQYYETGILEFVHKALIW